MRCNAGRGSRATKKANKSHFERNQTFFRDANTVCWHWPSICNKYYRFSSIPRTFLERVGGPKPQNKLKVVALSAVLDGLLDITLSFSNSLHSSCRTIIFELVTLLAATGVAIPLSAQSISAVSVSPNSGSGLTQVFTTTYSDSYGVSDISYVGMMIGSRVSIAQACYVLYVPGTNALFLLNDAGNQQLGPASLSEAATLSNSQCTLDASASTVSSSGNTLSIGFAVTFKLFHRPQEHLSIRGKQIWNEHRISDRRQVDADGYTTIGGFGESKLGSWDNTDIHGHLF